MRAVFAAILALFALPVCAADLAVNLSGTTGPDFANQLNDTDLEVARFVMQATGGDVGVDAITITMSNHLQADEAFGQLRLFYDADGNGTFDVSEELDVGQTPNGTDDFVTFTETFTAVDTLIRELQLRVDINNNPAAYGAAFEFSVDAGADVTLTVGTDTVSGTLPAVSNTLTVRHSENQLVPGTGNPTASRNVDFGKNNVAALHFIVSSLTPTAPGQLSGIDLSAITISITLGNVTQTDVVQRLSLYQDDGDSSFEPGSGEVLILERTPADIGKWTIAGSVITVTFDGSAVQLLSDIPSGSSKALWVGIDFDNGPEAVCEVSVTRDGILGALGQDADFVVLTPSSISGDVINLVKPKAPKKSADPPGEGGCSTDDAPSFLLLLMLAAAGFVAACANYGSKRNA